MITALLLLGVLSISAVIALVYEASHAPVGHEDGEGFHYGREKISTPVVSNYRPRLAPRPVAAVESRHVSVSYYQMIDR